MDEQGVWKRRGLRLANLFATFVTIIVVAQLVMAMARKTPKGLGYGWVITAISIGLVAGITVYAGIRLLVEARQRVLAIMALSNLQRRKRNTALVIVGLLVGSAIITSSLVVGDSLDATLQAEYAESLDETDIVIDGTDVLGLPVWWNQTRAEEMVDTLYNESDIDAVSLGIEISIGMKSDVHRTVESSSALLAMDAQYQQQGAWNPFGGEGGLHYSEIKDGSAFLSQKGADKMHLVVGDSVEISWTEMSMSGRFNRETTNLTIQAIVPTKASGYEGGGEVTLYTTLSQAQEIFDHHGEVN
ncbi:MAG TPA: ABC transporter permease, partial [Candidatus Thalassarchaeaceae archaeon]|nr:ABC transporter permease [Candidatus Thalassarchaeaceae archaeon]